MFLLTQSTHLPIYQPINPIYLQHHVHKGNTDVYIYIYPVSDKKAQFQELLEAVVRGTTNEEEGARTYVLTKAVDSSDFVIVES